MGHKYKRYKEIISCCFVIFIQLYAFQMQLILWKTCMQVLNLSTLVDENIHQRIDKKLCYIIRYIWY